MRYRYRVENIAGGTAYSGGSLRRAMTEAWEHGTSVLSGVTGGELYRNFRYEDSDTRGGESFPACTRYDGVTVYPRIKE